MENHELPYEPVEPKKKSPFYVFLSVVVAIAILILSVEGYFYLIHPEPDVIVTLEEVKPFIPSNLIDLKDSFTSYQPTEVQKVLSETQDPLKQIANFVAAKACRKADSLCQSKALFYFVRDRINYVADPQFHDKLENPLVTLKTGGADCEDMAVLLGGLEKAIGNDARLVFIPGHAYAQVRIPDYRDAWYSLEATCKTCKWDEVPDENALQMKTFQEL